VRQLADSSGEVTLAQSYEPFGSTLLSEGDGPTVFQFTGEQRDSYIKLLYLRARWLDTDSGRFLSKDPWQDYSTPQTLNGWAYVEGNPINRLDPSGNQSILDDWLKDPQRVNQAIFLAKMIYSKQGLWRNCASTPDDGLSASDSVDDLLTDFICEYGPENRRFTVDDTLTRELAWSQSIYDLRAEFYLGGAHSLGPALKPFGGAAFGSATVDLIYLTLYDLISDCRLDLDAFAKVQTRINTLLPGSITHFLGTFEYQVKLISGNRVRFIINNQTDLESGTRIPGRFNGISLEQYATNPTAYANDPLISILSPKDRSMTIGSEGGGIMKQSFVWDEQFLPDFARRHWFPPWPLGMPLIRLMP
jgi:RHS repeat-associated protein